MPTGPPAPAAFLPDIQAAIADHAAIWAKAPDTDASGRGLPPQYDAGLLRAAVLPGVRAEVARQVEPFMRSALQDLKVRSTRVPSITNLTLIVAGGSLNSSNPCHSRSFMEMSLWRSRLGIAGQSCSRCGNLASRRRQQGHQQAGRAGQAPSGETRREHGQDGGR